MNWIAVLGRAGICTGGNRVLSRYSAGRLGRGAYGGVFWGMAWDAALGGE